MLWRPTHPLQDGENPSEPPGEGFDSQIKTTYYDSVIDSLCVYCVCQCSRAIFPLFPKCPIHVDWEEQQHESRRLIEPVIHYIWTDPYQFCFPQKAIIVALMLVESWRTKRITCFDLYSQSSSFMADLEAMQYWVFIKLLQFPCETLQTFSDHNERFWCILAHFSTF